MNENRWELRYGDEVFPDSLMEEGAPHVEVLYGRGDPSVLQTSCLSIIGARRATPYGIAISEMAGRIAAESGITVVSGGAMGCDYAGSRAALNAGGKTIIVSGVGADKVYPASSADIFAEAAAGAGAVISLERWGKDPRKHAFPRRNNIIEALSQSLMVAEAGERSGTMSTADAALRMDRTIYAAPGSIFSPTSQGTNRLIAEGALPICSEMDLESRIAMDYGLLRMTVDDETIEHGEVLSALAASPARPDDLAPRLEMHVLTLLSELADYEARGIVERLVDGRYSLTARAYEQYRTGRQFFTGGKAEG